MTLLRRILTEKRAAIVPLALLILVDVLAYVLVVYPLERRAAGAADRAANSAAALRAAGRDHDAARAVLTGRARAQQELATFYDKVLPADFIAARSITYSRPPALARKANLQYSGGSFAIDQTLKEGRVGRLVTKIALQGDYESLRRFIFDLETAPEFIIIDSVALAQGDASKPLTFDIELSTYFRRPNGS